MKKILLVFICILFSHCKKNNDDKNLIYKQLIKYRDELKENTEAIDHSVAFRTEEDSIYKNAIVNSSETLIEFEDSFEKIKFKERNKRLKLRDSFNDRHKLFLHFDVVKYDENISDSIFNRVMEIDFYNLKYNFQTRYLIKHGCK